MTIRSSPHFPMPRLALWISPFLLVSCATVVSFDAYDTTGARPFLTEAGVVDGPLEAASPRAHVTQIAAGSRHTCALLDNGQVRCWGENYFGQLGNGTRIDASVPVAVHGVTGATAISAAASHTCAIVANGEVQCWGLNSSGQLGDGMTSFPTEAVRVTGLRSATALATGTTHSCAIGPGGYVFCWGTNVDWQLGLDDVLDPRPHTLVAVGGISGAKVIASSANASCAILANGEVRCWGDSAGGTRPASNVSGATVLAVGSTHACAAVANGEVRCWSLTNGGREPAFVINGVTGATALAASDVVDAEGLSSRTCAILGDGSLRCWGPGTDAIPFDGLRPSIGIATGGDTADDHTCAVIVGGDEVRCWGSDTHGQLGDGMFGTTKVVTPVAVVGFP